MDDNKEVKFERKGANQNIDPEYVRMVCGLSDDFYDVDPDLISNWMKAWVKDLENFK